MASGQLFYFLGCTLYHRFGSATHPSKIIPVASMVVLLASIPLGFVGVLGPVYAAFWLLQFASSLFWPPIMAWLTEGTSGNELGQRISYFNRSWMAALIIAPPIAGALYRWNPQINFAIITLAFLVNIVLVSLLKRSYNANLTRTEHADAHAEHSESDGKNPSPPMWNKKLDLYRYTAWLSFFCSVVFVGFLITIVPLHIRDGLGYTESTAGWVLLLRCVAGFVAFALLAKFTAWHFNFRWFFIQKATLALCALLFIIAGSNIHFYFGIVIIYGLVNAACNTSSVFYSRATGKNPKKNIALHEMFLCLGTAVGTAGGGLLYQHFGFIGVCFALLLLSIGAAGFVFFIQKRRESYA